ncbi:hypothetical protein JHW40_04040 [Paracoccus alcaliphilus]|nr:hypothetical protein JHW40_04040 [Paracoccus alcaliphilus]
MPGKNTSCRTLVSLTPVSGEAPWRDCGWPCPGTGLPNSRGAAEVKLFEAIGQLESMRISGFGFRPMAGSVVCRVSRVAQRQLRWFKTLRV